LSITKRVQEGISTLESKSSSSGPSTPVSCKTLAYAPLEAIVAMARVRAQHPILCKRKRRHPVEAHALGGILRQSCAGSAAAAATKQRQTCLSIGVDDLDTIKSVQLCARASVWSPRDDMEFFISSSPSSSSIQRHELLHPRVVVKQTISKKRRMRGKRVQHVRSGVSRRLVHMNLIMVSVDFGNH
jgi:hypothetical protein